MTFSTLSREPILITFTYSVLSTSSFSAISNVLVMVLNKPDPATFIFNRFTCTLVCKFPNSSMRILRTILRTTSCSFALGHGLTNGLQVAAVRNKQKRLDDNLTPGETRSITMSSTDLASSYILNYLLGVMFGSLFLTFKHKH